MVPCPITQVSCRGGGWRRKVPLSLPAVAQHLIWSNPIFKRCHPSPSLNLEPCAPPQSHWLKGAGGLFSHLLWLALREPETGAVAPSLSLLKHKDGWQGSLNLAPLALCHRESHPCCSKCQAAKGLSCIFSYFGRNQTAG